MNKKIRCYDCQTIWKYGKADCYEIVGDIRD